MEIPHSFGSTKAHDSVTYKKNRFPLYEEEPKEVRAAVVRPQPQLKAPSRSRMVAAQGQD